jgi:hypothetical protein
VEEIPEEDIPEVMAEVTPVTVAPMVAAYEVVDLPAGEGPVEAVVEAVVEDVTDEEGDFEMVEAPPTDGRVGHRKIEEAHENLLDKLLGK